MKLFVLAAPLGLLLASGALAQTSTTEGATEGTTGGETSTMQSGSMTYGTDWSDAVGSVIYGDAERTQLRTPDEIVQGWPSLPQDDRDKVLAECERFKNDSNATNLTDGSSDATAGAAGTETSATGDASTGAATAGADTSAEAGTATGTATGTDTGTASGAATGDTSTDTDAAAGTMGTNVGYDMNAMMVICPSIENL